ncbi:hypothetical protein [Enhygromyxa salina]|uniref:hypothetical protein n=1 Tax=Enhygromyxa salina TaxID=215803 RepID=UPI0004E6E6DD|nr:hypothetical protein [Enhygromyxa salina]
MTSLDEVLQELAALRNENREVSCACPHQVLDGSGDVFKSEMACLAGSDPVQDSDLACIEDVLAGSGRTTEQHLALIQCFNDEMSADIECKRAHLDSCADQQFSPCSDDTDTDTCGGDYSQDTLEALWICTY